MRKAIFVFLLAASVSVAGQSEEQKPRYVPGQVIVKFSPQAKAYSASAISALGYQEKSTNEEAGYKVVETRQNQSVEHACAEFLSRGDVIYAQPNYYYYSMRTVPNDPSFSNQTYLDVIRGPEAWDIDTGVTSETIAIVDSGIDTNNVDVTTKLVTFLGVDVVDNDSVPADRDSFGQGTGHGIAVAGIAAAITNNASLVAGVNWNAPIMPVRVLDTSASATTDSLVIGMRLAIDNGARVINLSLGFNSAQVDNALEAVLTRAQDSQIIVTASAGNLGNTSNPIVVYPASSLKTIAVGSSTNGDVLSTFSSYKQTAGLAPLEIVAPGEGLTVLNLNNGVSSATGTSMSSPIIAGAAALTRGGRPGLTPAQFLRYLRATAKDIGDPGFDEKTGAGRLDLYKLVQVATAVPNYSGANFLAPETGTTSPVAGGRQSNTTILINQTDSYVGYGTQLKASTGAIRFYFSPDSTQPGDTAFILTQKGNLGHNSGNIDVILRGDRRVEYRLQDSGSIMSTTKLNDTQWYHIAVTYGAAGMSLWINGDSEASVLTTGGPPVSDTVFIGVPNTMGSAQPAHGRFDSLNFAETQLIHFPSALFAVLESQANASNITSGKIEVAWKTYSSETNAITIDIYADTDQQGFNGTLLKSGLTNDDHEHAVSISSLTSGKSYYTYVVTTDASTSNNIFPEKSFSYSQAAFSVAAAAVSIPSNGSEGGVCIIERSGINPVRFRAFRDWMLSNDLGRFLCRLYYSLLS